MFPHERLGYLKDYQGQEHVLEMQDVNSNFTLEGLLEVKVSATKEDEVLIEVYHQCYPYSLIVKKDQIKYLHKSRLKYFKSK